VTKTIEPDAWHVARPSLLTGAAFCVARAIRWLVVPERPLAEDLIAIGVCVAALWAWRHFRRRRFSLVFEGPWVEGPTDAGRRQRFLVRDLSGSERIRAAWPSATYLTNALGKRLYVRTDWLSSRQVEEALSLLQPSEVSVRTKASELAQDRGTDSAE
jgi:hypothetical protein